MAEIQPFEDPPTDLFSTMYKSKQRLSVKSVSDTNQDDMDNSKAGIKNGEIPKLLSTKLNIDTINEVIPSARRLKFKNPFYDIIIVESFKAHNCQMCFSQYEEENELHVKNKCYCLNKCHII